MIPLPASKYCIQIIIFVSLYISFSLSLQFALRVAICEHFYIVIPHMHTCHVSLYPGASSNCLKTYYDGVEEGSHCKTRQRSTLFLVTDGLSLYVRCRCASCYAMCMLQMVFHCMLKCM